VKQREKYLFLSIQIVSNHIQTNKYALNDMKKINHIIRIEKKKCYKFKICSRLYYVIYTRKKVAKHSEANEE
jgi:hypothetical protein